MQAKPGTPRRKLHSIAGWLDERALIGEIAVGRVSYPFRYELASAAITDGHLSFTGRFTLTRPLGTKRTVENVTATVKAQQGGVDNPPGVRGHLPINLGEFPGNTLQQPGTAGTPPGQAAGTQPGTPPGTPNNDEQVRLSAPTARPGAGELPVLQATGARAFVAALYLKLGSLEGKGLGIPYDLSDVQLNARLFPMDPIGRSLVWEFTDAMRWLHGDRRDAALAAEEVRHINRILAGETPQPLAGVRQEIFDELA